MPTGYTAKIADGQTFEEFILSCARAFGALVEMRDEPADAPIPEEFKPSAYHTTQIGVARAKMEEIRTMRLSTGERMAKQAFEAETEYHEKRIREARELQAKYEAVLERVREWVPPTPDHVGLKDFMVKQIVSSILFDCTSTIDYYSKNTPVLLTGEQWMAKTAEEAQRRLAYHREELAKEVERVDSRNAWVRALRDSLAAKEVY